MSSSDEEKPSYIPFGDRPEWSDVVPIKEDEGPEPVCSIAYTPQFTDTMNYFRAILRADERSERALQLSKEAIAVNSANYTAWYFRRLVLEALNSDLKKELEFITKIGTKNPKNYQIWYHRRYLIEKTKEFGGELEFTASQLDEDAKNYHAWAHRQWVIQTNNLWDKELEFTDSLLKKDWKNNSAWNQRYFAITFNRSKPITKEIRDREIAYTFSWIRKSPNNQSAWTYLKGLFLDEKLTTHSEIKSLCLESVEKFPTTPFPVSFLVDIYESECTKESIQKANELCNVLENSLDTLHRKFWVYRRQNLPKVE